jgi:ribosomal protein S18 acetylase RimI-like enzyme
LTGTEVVIMNITIRQADPADIPTLVAVISTAFKKVADRLGLPLDKDSEHASNITDSWVTKDMDKGVRYYIIEADGTAAGAVTVGHPKPDASFIGRLAVLPDFQGMGLGRKLFTHAIDKAAETGADHISVGVISDEKHLIEWYKRMGFRVNRRNRFKHFPFEVTMMRRELKEKS